MRTRAIMIMIIIQIVMERYWLRLIKYMTHLPPQSPTLLVLYIKQLFKQHIFTKLNWKRRDQCCITPWKPLLVCNWKVSTVFSPHMVTKPWSPEIIVNLSFLITAGRFKFLILWNVQVPDRMKCLRSWYCELFEILKVWNVWDPDDKWQ